MNILIFISSLHIGGAEKQAINDANMLCDDNDVHLIVFSDGLLRERLSPKVKFSVLKKTGYLSTSKTLASYIKNHKIDLIHASLFAPMIIGALAALRSDVPVFWSFHSHEYDIPLKSRLALKFLAKSKKIKNIFYVNNELKVFFENSLGLPSKKAGVLYNTSEFTPTEPEKTDSKTIVIGYVGRIIELKRVYLLLELAEYLIQQKVTNFKIEIYGDGPLREDLENLSKQKKLVAYIRFHGFKTNLEDIYKSFDLFINPSQEECLSIATIDAGIVGVPMIVFDVGGNDEIVIHGKSGYVIKDKQQLIKHTLELINNKDRRYLFGQYAMEYCAKNFTPTIRKQKLQEAFNLIND